MQQFYIQLFSPHGLIRYHNPEIGRDKDTGGQVKYVLELLEALSANPQVRKVDLFTRKITDKRVSNTYSEEIEKVNDKARIVRMVCGGNMYRNKENLWDYLDEFVDKTIRFLEAENELPDVVHGHYADGNYIAREMSNFFGAVFLATGHSLGRNKQAILLKQGMRQDKINEKFKIDQRIAEEEISIAASDAVIVSTQHEINVQYQTYESRFNAKFSIIPPGVNTQLFYPYYRLQNGGHQLTVEQEQAVHRVNEEIGRFLFNPDKPLILSIGRADKRKNFETIIEAYGQDKALQSMANLAIFAGVRKDISLMPEDEQEILTRLLLLMDKYDLYGKMAIPKKNDPTMEVPEIYRLAAQQKGVFVNATPGENFGLTLIEAAACGLPVLASPTGGPKEIVTQGQNGMLINVENSTSISTALKEMIADNQQWDTYSNNGIKAASKKYSWEAHAYAYLQLVDGIYKEKAGNDWYMNEGKAFGRKLSKASRFIISDLDGTLIEGDNAEGLNELNEWVANRQQDVVFGIATGRNKKLTQQVLDQFNIPSPDIIICNVGTEIYYTTNMVADSGWQSHIEYQWKRDELLQAMRSQAKLTLQPNDAQWPCKLSYFVDKTFNDDDLANIYSLLDTHKLKANLLLTENKYLDIIPFRASKGNAIKYLGYKWKIPMENFITSGNSGNDIDMLKGNAKGVVVGNYSKEMEVLRHQKDIYFANAPLAEGVMEGIKHYEQELLETT